MFITFSAISEAAAHSKLRYTNIFATEISNTFEEFILFRGFLFYICRLHCYWIEEKTSYGENVSSLKI